MTVSRAAAVVLAMSTLLVASCTRYVDDARAVAAADRSPLSDASQCESVDVPLTTVPGRRDDEPVMKIPQPQGWVRSTKLDSELFRFAMVNRSLTVDGFAPNVVVTLESALGFQHPADVFDTQRDALESGFGATDLRVSEHTLCGQPAETVQYLTPVMGNLATHPGTVVIAVMHTDDRTYAASVTIQTANPGDPVYQRDAEAILTGFQFLPPQGQ
ncbi:hypothetical protein ACGFK1_28110 [Mycobacterium sp. NPDC048908]|uniref:hypothetical protein n=1 Tax=Mycobacterium sp. NPDC048908 TaxID=3364292 RepID=UPI003717841D